LVSAGGGEQEKGKAPATSEPGRGSGGGMKKMLPIDHRQAQGGHPALGASQNTGVVPRSSSTDVQNPP